MEKHWQETFELHSQSEEFADRVSHAKTIIKDALDRRTPYLAYSGGKDSLVMLHLVCRYKPDILVQHHDQGKYMPRQMAQEIIDNAHGAGATNVRIYPFRRDLWTDIVYELAEEGYNAVFVGLRAEESIGRRNRIRQGRSLTMMQEFWPLRNWTWMDVWGYIITQKLSYSSAYDIYGPVVGWDRVRFHSFFDPRMDSLGCSNVDGVLAWRYRFNQRAS